MSIAPTEITPSDVDWLRSRSQVDDPPSRSRLARELCERKEWRDFRGRLRASSTQILLSRMEKRGLVDLPRSRGPLPRAGASAKSAPSLAPSPLVEDSDSSLESLGEIEIVRVRSGATPERAQWREVMAHHYLGPDSICGRRILYLFKCAKGFLGAAAFSSAAWQLKARDSWIGWTPSARKRNLQLVVNNSRFCLIPRIPNLASHVLSKCLDRLSADWNDEFGYNPVLVETFVDVKHFKGVCYAGAGWKEIGKTRGRGRQDRKWTPSEDRAPKLVFVKELSDDARARLQVDVVHPRDIAGKTIEEIEFGEADFQDQRLTERLQRIARNFRTRMTANIPEACRGIESEARATYRFFSNERVTVERILKPHFEATLRRAKDEKVVLAIQDTTTLNYASHTETEGLGPIAKSHNHDPEGILLHETLLLNTAGTPLGLLHAQFWEREIEDFGKARQRYRDPIEAKESIKWLNSHREATIAQQRLEGATVVSVGDREADIYELFLQAKQQEGSAELLVRALHRHRVLDVEEDQPKHLLEFLQSKPCADRFEMQITSKNAGGPRKAQMELRFAPVRLKPPFDKRQFKTSIDLWGILVSEVGWAGKDEHRIEWLLLTTLPVTTVEECLEKIDWYKLRWRIEIYHRVLKSGCAVEERQLRSAKDLEKCVAIDLVMAFDVMNLTQLAREKPNAPCTIALEDVHWKTLVANRDGTRVEPKEPPTMREAVRLIAKLGGFLGRKGDKEPGNTTVWRGFQRLNDMSVGFAIMWGLNVPDTPDGPPVAEEDDW